MPVGESGYERAENDFYPTPAWVTEILLDNVELPTSRLLWEPAAGDGAILKVFEDRGLRFVAHDIAPQADNIQRMNFLLTMAHPRKCGAIITNPPYKHADAFMRHAMFFCSAPGGPDVLALLFRNDFDTAKKREDAFRHPAFSKKLVLTKRPRWFPEKGPSPRHNYAWYIWDWREKNKPPTIEWKS